MPIDQLWQAYQATSVGGSTVWASLIQVVIFSIAAGGIIASAIVATLSSAQVAKDPQLSLILYVLLSAGWGLVVVLCGTYYLLTFGGMLRVSRHTKIVECRLLDADPRIDATTLFNHSPFIGRGSSIAGYAIAALAALLGAFGPQVLFVLWWGPHVNAPQGIITAGWVWIAAQAVWFAAYAPSVWFANRPLRCRHGRALTSAST